MFDIVYILNNLGKHESFKTFKSERNNRSFPLIFLLTQDNLQKNKL